METVHSFHQFPSTTSACVPCISWGGEWTGHLVAVGREVLFAWITVGCSEVSVGTADVLRCVWKRILKKDQVGGA